ncbi:hypothetical protein D6D04_07538 [Aureobasidium pullulans]|nr:hypothetical protein D6D04_07538 [Aureobasidium pullulans]
MAHTTLLSLGPEIHSIIASQLSSHDFGHLRSTCKELCNRFGVQFAKQCFAERRFLFTQDSMQGLVDLTAHKVFAPHIKKILFGSGRLSIYPSCPHWTTEDEMDAEALRLRQLYVAAAKKQEAFIDSKQHIRMMHAALRNLKKYIGKKKYNNRVTLGIFDVAGEIATSKGSHYCHHSVTYFRTAYGFDKFLGELSEFQKWGEAGLDPVEEWYLNPLDTTRDIRQACNKANFEWNSMELDCIWHQSFPFASTNGWFTVDDGCSSQAHVHLAIGMLDHEEYGDADLCVKVSRGYESELRILTKNRRLEFRVKAGDTKDESAFRGVSEEYGKISKDFGKDVFQELRLQDCVVGLRRLCNFFVAHAKTLRRVELVNVRLDVTDRWATEDCASGTPLTLLKCIREKLKLDSLVCNNLRCNTSEEIFPSNEYTTFIKGPVEWNGTRNITETMNVLIGSDNKDWKEEATGWDQVEVDEEYHLDDYSLDFEDFPRHRRGS